MTITIRPAFIRQKLPYASGPFALEPRACGNSFWLASRFTDLLCCHILCFWLDLVRSRQPMAYTVRVYLSFSAEKVAVVVPWFQTAFYFGVAKLLKFEMSYTKACTWLRRKVCRQTDKAVDRGRQLSSAGPKSLEGANPAPERPRWGQWAQRWAQ